MDRRQARAYNGQHMNVDEQTLRRVMGDVVRQAVRQEISAAGLVTHQELNAVLDTRFHDFESRMDTRFKSFETKINLDLARFFGDTHKYFDRRFDKFEKKFDAKFDKLTNSVDGVVKRLADDDVERGAMQHQLDRHETNINKLARHTGVTISPP